MAERKRTRKAPGNVEREEVPLVGTGIAPVSPPEAGAEPPPRKRNYQKRLAEAVKHSVEEHPDGSAPPLDRLTQDRDPSKDL